MSCAERLVHSDDPLVLVLIEECAEYFVDVDVDQGDELADVDPQDCPGCIAAGDLCDWHRGYQAGRDSFAEEAGLLVDPLDWR